MSIWVRMTSSSVGSGIESLGEYFLGLLLATVGFLVLALTYTNVCMDLQEYLCGKRKLTGDVLGPRERRLTRLYLSGSVMGMAAFIWAWKVELVVVAVVFALAIGPMLSIHVAGKSCGRLRLARGLGVLVFVLFLGLAVLALVELSLLAGR